MLVDVIEKYKPFIPGVVLSLTIAAAAKFLSEHYGAPVMLFAVLIGMAFHFLMENSPCKDGIEFCAKPLLRVGVALLGIRVTLDQIFSLGYKPVLFVIICTILTILFGILVASLCKKCNWSGMLLGILTGGAVAICGASAALAISLVLPKNEHSERDTLFTVISVTILSTIAMIIYPILFKLFAYDDITSGILIGMTIHDVAQVVGAGFSISNEAGEIATYVKLLRVTLLPIIIISLILWFKRYSTKQQDKAKVTFPWFAIAFVVLLLINSTGIIPEAAQTSINDASKWMLITAISALGVKTSLKNIADCGIGQIVVVVAETLFLLILAMLLISL